MFIGKKEKKEGTVTVGIRGHSEDDRIILASETLSEEEKKAKDDLK